MPCHAIVQVKFAHRKIGTAFNVLLFIVQLSSPCVCMAGDCVLERVATHIHQLRPEVKNADFADEILCFFWAVLLNGGKGRKRFAVDM